MILLLDNYDSFTFNLYQYFLELGYECQVHRNDKISVAEIKRRKPACIVLSPGPGRPSDSGICLEVVKTFAGKVPVLGVCLGHQTIGEAFGGKVIKASRLMHGKTSQIFHGRTGSYRKLPNPFAATRYHSLIVERSTLPECLTVTSETEDGLIMGLRHKKLLVEGVQFHPESIMTIEGKALLRNFLEEAI